MPTIDELRAALHAQAQNGPAMQDVLAAARADARTRHPAHGGHAGRRHGALAVAAAAIAASLAVPTLVASNRNGDPRLTAQQVLNPASPTSVTALGTAHTTVRPSTVSGQRTQPELSPPGLKPGASGTHRATGPASTAVRASTSTTASTSSTLVPTSTSIPTSRTATPSGAPTSAASDTESTTSTSATQAPPAPSGVPGPDGPTVATVLRYPFEVAPIDGYTVTYQGVRPNAQYADVAFAVTDGGPVGEVTLYAAGAFDPTSVQLGVPITVGAVGGFYNTIADQRIGAAAGVSLAAVAWPYAPGAWAVVQGDWSERLAAGTWVGDPEAAELAVAAAVNTTTTTPLLLPMQVTYLPSGTVAESARTGSSPFAVLGLSDGGTSDASLPPVPGSGAALQISALPFDPNADLRQVDDMGNLHLASGADIHLGAPITVAGARAFQTPSGDVTAVYPDRVMTVRFTGYGSNRYSSSQMMGIAQGLVLSSSTTDLATWFDATTAIR